METQPLHDTLRKCRSKEKKTSEQRKLRRNLDKKRKCIKRANDTEEYRALQQVKAHDQMRSNRHSSGITSHPSATSSLDTD
ncbi:172_t:CDS:1, partial [Acaulospora morrowiae]